MALKQPIPTMVCFFVRRPAYHDTYSLFTLFCIIGISDKEKSGLLHCVVVGGGPTGVEFSGELSDFIEGDVSQRYAHVKDRIRVTLIEVYIPYTCLHLYSGSSIYLEYPFWILELGHGLDTYPCQTWVYESKQHILSGCFESSALSLYMFQSPPNHMPCNRPMKFCHHLMWV